MPSLVYIARIRSVSEELARSLRSAGYHVRSFKPGDITEDECLLVMTSESLPAALHAEHDEIDIDREFVGVPNMNEQLGSQSAVWDSITTAVADKWLASPEAVDRVVSTGETKEVEPAFIPTEHRRRAIANAPQKWGGVKAPIDPPQTIAVSSGDVSRDAKKIRPTKQEYGRLFRNPWSTVVAVLVFAVVYRGLILRSTTGATMGRTASYSTRPDSANSLLPGSATRGRTAHHRSIPSPMISADPQAERARERRSADDFVAGDFTHRFDLHAQSVPTQQNPALKHSQGSSKVTRIVVD